ncbi:MAG: transketolase [Bacteroidales bacterium]|nr:transketolase [Bacteroidales bacterium]
MEKLDLNSYAGLGQAGALFSMYLPDIIEQYPQLRVLTADMSYIAKLERFKALYPNQFINVGIAEQNLLGVCAGLTSEGFKCVALAQATFITMRCFEQVRQYMSYMGYPIILIGLAGGFQLQFMGNTHYALEDLALMRSVPDIVVMSPADAGEAVKCFQAALTINKPVYIRLTGDSSNMVYEEDYDFDYQKSVCLKDGNDITIFATGSMVNAALDAAKLVEEQLNCSVNVTDIYTLSPLDKGAVEESLKSNLLVSLEEHHIEGGLGTAIAEVLSSKTNVPPLLKLGIGMRYSEVGDYEYLLKQHRLIPELIAKDIINRYIQE